MNSIESLIFELREQVLLLMALASVDHGIDARIDEDAKTAAAGAYHRANHVLDRLQTLPGKVLVLNVPEAAK